MPDKEKIYTEDQLNKIFLEIGRSKESTAQGILQQKQEEEKAKLNSLKGRLGMLNGGTGIESDKEDDEIVAEMQRIEEEIAKVQAGESPRRSDEDEAVAEALQEEETPDAFESLAPVYMEGMTGFVPIPKMEEKPESAPASAEPSVAEAPMASVPMPSQAESPAPPATEPVTESASEPEEPAKPLEQTVQSPGEELDVDLLLEELGERDVSDAPDAFEITREILDKKSQAENDQPAAENSLEQDSPQAVYTEDMLEFLGVGNEPAVHAYLGVVISPTDKDAGAYAYRLLADNDQRVLTASAKRITGGKRATMRLALTRLLDDIRDCGRHVAIVHVSAQTSRDLQDLLSRQDAENSAVMKLVRDVQRACDIQVISEVSERVAKEVIAAESLLFYTS